MISLLTHQLFKIRNVLHQVFLTVDRTGRQERGEYISGDLGWTMRAITVIAISHVTRATDTLGCITDYGGIKRRCKLVSRINFTNRNKFVPTIASPQDTSFKIEIQEIALVRFSTSHLMRMQSEKYMKFSNCQVYPANMSAVLFLQYIKRKK